MRSSVGRQCVFDGVVPLLAKADCSVLGYSSQQPTILIPEGIVKDVLYKETPIYLILDETTLGSEHYNALGLGCLAPPSAFASHSNMAGGQLSESPEDAGDHIGCGDKFDHDKAHSMPRICFYLPTCQSGWPHQGRQGKAQEVEEHIHRHATCL